MNDYNEMRFGYLRVLTTDEKLAMIAELEEDIEALNEIIDDRRTSGEQRSELRSDVVFETTKLEYFRKILEEKTL